MEAESAPVPPPEMGVVDEMPPSDLPPMEVTKSMDDPPPVADAPQTEATEAPMEQEAAPVSEEHQPQESEMAPVTNGNGTADEDHAPTEENSGNGHQEEESMETSEQVQAEAEPSAEEAPKDESNTEDTQLEGEVEEDKTEEQLEGGVEEDKPEDQESGDKEESEEKSENKEESSEEVKKEEEGDENEEKTEEKTEEKKDSFDSMLEGKSEDKESKKDDKDEDKDDEKDEDKSEDKPATVADGDALEEALKDGDEKKEGESSEDKKEEDKKVEDDKKDDEDDKKDEEVVITSEKVPSDEKYYEDMKPEELKWLEENPVTIESISSKLPCTICSKNCEATVNIGVYRHPHLGICMCRTCRKFYGDGDWPRTEDGDEYCRMCGQGGDILLCDKCPNAFCKKCLQRSLGARSLREITKSEEWACLLCNPEPIAQLKAQYYCAYKNKAEIKERADKDREVAKEKAAAKRAKKNDVTAKEKEALVKSPQNFLEENISEAFKTLEVYQKSLETERTRCIKTVKEGMTVDMATSITRKLRKLYAVTQKNMDLLDRAIVESFVENFPTDSTRIHMGRVAPAANDPPPPRSAAKRGGGKGSSSKSKIKIKPKKKKTGGNAKGGKSGSNAGRKRKEIQVNGSPVYAEYVTPSLTGGNKKGKKRSRYEESDVECIEVSEESDAEYYQPKKKSRPGPASSKKSKPGPASKKKVGPKSKTRY